MRERADRLPTWRPGGARLALLCLTAWAAVGGSCVDLFSDPSDRMLYLDPIDPVTGRVAEIVPGAQWFHAGPDGEFETRDDVTIEAVRGDVDLVLRAGTHHIGSSVPPSTSAARGPFGLAEPFGRGIPIDFVVAPIDSRRGVVPGIPVVSPSIEGHPVLVAAFADLDDDGFIGITHLDGDTRDGKIEKAELIPVGRRFAITEAGRAVGSLFVAAGGPSAAPLNVMLGAAAYTGELDPDFFGGAVPNGPAVMTRLPFLPRLSPDRVINGDFVLPAHPDTRESVEIEGEIHPSPIAPVISEVFTLRIDGSETTIDGAHVASGSFARFGLGVRPDRRRFRSSRTRPLRPGLDDAGFSVPYEILQHLGIDDDGRESQLTVRVLPLDRLGNVADLDVPTRVTVRTGGTIRIVSPDSDGDPYSESLVVTDTRGADVRIDDSGDVFDDPSSDELVIDGAGATYTLDIALPDPDVDDSSIVDRRDRDIVKSFKGVRYGDEEFDPRYDLNSDGRIDGDDADIVGSYFGAVIPNP
jgi:hypothetical protein